MTDSGPLHHALLRPAVLHVLRAAGFHSTRPSVLDSVTELASRYFLLLAQQTAQFAAEREAVSSESTSPLELDTASEVKDPTHPSSEPQTSIPTPTLPDALAAMDSTAVFSNTLTPSEEAWRERLRRPLSTYPAGAAREKERRRRDAEDTRDVRDFTDWCMGNVPAEARRIAGLEVREEEVAIAEGGIVGVMPPTKNAEGEVERKLVKVQPDDYVSLMKKKYSRTGNGARYAATILGRHGRGELDDLGRGTVRIEGGPETVRGWREEVKRRRLDSKGSKAGSRDAASDAFMEEVEVG